MRTECTRNCWIAGGAAGLLVWLAIGLVGSAGWMAGLVLGLVTAGLLGGVLVWGLCQGAGSLADNEALLAGGWPDEPFNPGRRVVGPGGELVSEEPLAQAARIPGGAPLDSMTVTAMQGADATRRPRIVAGAGPDAPVRAQAARDPAPAEPAAAEHTAGEPTAAESAPAAPGSGSDADERARLQPAPGVEDQAARRAPAPVEGMVLDEPHLPGSGGEALTLESTGFVEPETDSEAGADPRAPEGHIEPIVDEDPSGEGDTTSAQPEVTTLAAAAGESPAGADDLTRIRGVGPMLQNWLAGYGVTRFEQIAAWDDADIARYAGMMGRMGHRIRGEDWVGQARLLAAGGETAHSHAAETGEAG